MAVRDLCGYYNGELSQLRMGEEIQQVIKEISAASGRKRETEGSDGNADTHTFNNNQSSKFRRDDPLFWTLVRETIDRSWDDMEDH